MKYLINLSDSIQSKGDVELIQHHIKLSTKNISTYALHADTSSKIVYFAGVEIDLDEADMLVMKLSTDIVLVDYTTQRVTKKFWAGEVEVVIK